MLILELDGFAAYLSLNDRHPNTIRKHTWHLKQIARYVDSFTHPQIQEWLLQLKTEGKSNAYLNNLINAVRLYSQFKELAPELQHFKQFKKTNPPKATLSDEEIEAFLSLPYPKSNKLYYNHITHQMVEPVFFTRWKMWNVFWSICAYTGMRPGEVAKLTKSDVDWGRGVFVIEKTKTKQPRVAPIPLNIKPLLQSHLDKLTGDYLFPSAQGGKHYSVDCLPVVDNVDWHYHWKTRLDILKLTRPHLTPYSFRHSYATRLLEEEVSLFHVKKLMGHKDLKSTLVYEHLTTKDLIKAQQKLPAVRMGADVMAVFQSFIEHIRAFQLERDPRFSWMLSEDNGSLDLHVAIKKGDEGLTLPPSLPK